MIEASRKDALALVRVPTFPFVADLQWKPDVVVSARSKR
jgi:hypothetical protein